MKPLWVSLCLGLCILVQAGVGRAQTVEIPFKSHDGHPMLGKLTVPATERPHPVIIYVQTAEGATVDMKRPLRDGQTLNYFDLYREKLPQMDVAFFSYEGRGIHMGDSPPRYERIDWDVYNTSTLENKVRDVLTAVDVVRQQKGIDPDRIFLLGTSEGTLLAAEAASRAPEKVKGGMILYSVLSSTMKDMMLYMVADGEFIVWRRVLDADRDTRVSKAEFEDVNRSRLLGLQDVKFEVVDPNKDGFLTLEDFRVLRKPYLDAIAANNYEAIYGRLKTTAAVSLPKNWVEDHFAHPPIWTFLSPLTMPVGFFHASGDNLTPIEGVRNLEAQAGKAGKSNFEFRYFEGLDHSLGISQWFTQRRLPAGHQAIFEFIQAHTR
jgi:dienelactone hydrolase